jgi:hypothetical protein
MAVAPLRGKRAPSRLPDVPTDWPRTRDRGMLLPPRRRRTALVTWWEMTEGRSSGEENANLYTWGSNEARAGEFLDGGALLEVLDAFGEDGVRSYLLGYVEGIVDIMEDE